MNYKAHIPAGITASALVALAMGWGCSIPLLIGGAIGGALPDIDIEGSAVEKLGSKSAGVARRTVGKMGKGGKIASGAGGAIGKAIDAIFLKQIARAWRWFAEHVLGKFYRFMYGLGGKNGGKTLGERLGWLDEKKPWEHRGGITHSLLFLVTSCIITAPISLLLNSPSLFAGCEIGIVSHLITDSMCRSGVKFFFPWCPKIGFQHPNGGKKGRDIRILPPSLQVVTGKDRLTDAEIKRMPRNEQKEARTLRRRERMWQKVFQIASILLIVVLAAGLAGGPIGVTMGFGEENGNGNNNGNVNITSIFSNEASDSGTGDTGSSGDKAIESNGNTEHDNVDNDANSGQGTDNGSDQQITGNINEQESTVSGVNPMGDAVTTQQDGTIPETYGSTSLTSGDLGEDDLPKGIMKLPDESLWVVGVGPVSKETLDDPKWTFTDEEKTRLLAAAAAQRLNDVPDSISDIANNAANIAENAGQQAENAGSGLLGQLGIGSGSYKFGFLGITPWTKSSS